MDTQTLERIAQLESQVQSLFSAIATQSAEIDYLRKELAEEEHSRANSQEDISRAIATESASRAASDQALAHRIETLGL